MKLKDMTITLLGRTYTAHDLLRIEIEGGRAKITAHERDENDQCRKIEISLPLDMVEFEPTVIC